VIDPETSRSPLDRSFSFDTSVSRSPLTSIAFPQSMLSSVFETTYLLLLLMRGAMGVCSAG